MYIPIYTCMCFSGTPTNVGEIQRIDRFLGGWYCSRSPPTRNQKSETKALDRATCSRKTCTITAVTVSCKPFQYYSVAFPAFLVKLAQAALALCFYSWRDSIILGFFSSI